ncbi:tRNA(Arg) A34 adenosine deaminase TadA [Devosia sp. YR412]|uniref:nucleoside deaminase n=1 Tax=Devosia sp. YR412 TaxID=1881030 RepID=UPI0008B04018|nr:nucleoside deaminase [Devosia sp. YR412]SEP81134.1 tRNA(Arg) A34 adenosine deaminase TadA [Devosia sp. YR412]
MTYDQLSPNERAAMRDAVDRALWAKDQSGRAGIAAAVLRDGVSIGRGENEVGLQADPTKHAEMVALTEASHVMGQSDLSGCIMISTLQPCEMCLAALRFAGMERVILGATQDKVAAKYFMFPGLSIDDFQAAGKPFEAIGGQFEIGLLPLYIDSQEQASRRRRIEQSSRSRLE